MVWWACSNFRKNIPAVGVDFCLPCTSEVTVVWEVSHQEQIGHMLPRSSGGAMDMDASLLVTLSYNLRNIGLLRANPALDRTL